MRAKVWSVMVIISTVLALWGVSAVVLAQGPVEEPVDEPGDLQSQDIYIMAGEVNRYLPVQGRLTDSSGTPINGTKSVTYTLYDSETDGTELSQDSGNSVTFDNGYFSDTFGGISASDLDGKQAYLEFEVEGETMTPRQPLYPVPYAFSLVPGAWIKGTVNGWTTLYANNDGAHNSNLTMGVYGWASSPISATYGVYGRSDSSDGGGVYGFNTAAGVGVKAYSANGNPLEGYTQNGQVFRVSNGGDVYADGGYNCGNTITDTTSEANMAPCLQDESPADFAEMLPAAENLEPGDVLVIGPDGQLARSAAAYDAAVVGVHSTRPSYLGNSRYANQSSHAPLALVGVVPVKASAENGPIQPGDLLVTAATPGHAMQAETAPPVGTVIGKAMENLPAGTGRIKMLVMLQ